MGSSSHSSRSRSGKNVTLLHRWNEFRTWCAGRPYVVVGFGLSVLILGGALLGNPFSAQVAVIDESEEEEFTDLGLEVDSAVEGGHRPRSAPRVAAATPLPPSGSAEFTDLTAAFGRELSATSGIVAATYEGVSQPSPEAPVWLAGTIETDDEFADFALPSPADQFAPPVSGPILSPQ